MLRVRKGVSISSQRFTEPKNAWKVRKRVESLSSFFIFQIQSKPLKSYFIQVSLLSFQNCTKNTFMNKNKCIFFQKLMSNLVEYVFNFGSVEVYFLLIFEVCLYQ